MEVTFQAANATTGEVNADGTTAFYGASLKAAGAETLRMFGLRGGVEIVSVGQGKMADAGAKAGFIITAVNDQSVSKSKEVVSIAAKAKRSVFIQGVTASGKPGYFGFGKE